MFLPFFGGLPLCAISTTVPEIPVFVKCLMYLQEKKIVIGKVFWASNHSSSESGFSEIDNYHHCCIQGKVGLCKGVIAFLMLLKINCNFMLENKLLYYRPICAVFWESIFCWSPVQSSADYSELFNNLGVDPPTVSVLGD